MPREHRYYVYILASRSLTLYVGVTNSLYRRVLEHKSGKLEGFTKRYNINRLVWYEAFQFVQHAITRETEIKSWRRSKKLALIASLNPAWQDLAEGWGELADARAIPPFAKRTADSSLRSE